MKESIAAVDDIAKSINSIGSNKPLFLSALT